MAIHDPPHPGEFIREIYLAPYDISVRKVAQSLGVSASTLTRLLNGESSVPPRWRCVCRRRWVARRELAGVARPV